MYFHTITEIQAEITKIIAQAKTDFGFLNEEQLNWKPNATEWSVGQCLDHLVQGADAYEPIFLELISKERSPNFWRKLPLLPSIFGKQILKAVGPVRDKKTKTFPIFEPAKSEVSPGVVEKLVSRLEQFSNLAGQLEDYDLDLLLFTLNRFGIILFNKIYLSF